jgi:hypothetical protein
MVVQRCPASISGTTALATEELGGISATPVRLDDLYIFWQRGPKPRSIEIILILLGSNIRSSR